MKLAHVIATVLALAAGLRAEKLYYAYTSGTSTGLAEIEVDRAKASIVAQRSLGVRADFGEFAALRVTPDGKRVVAIGRSADAENVWIVEVAGERRTKTLKLPALPNFITATDEGTFIASERSVWRVDLLRATTAAVYTAPQGARITALAAEFEHETITVALAGLEGGARLVALRPGDLHVRFDIALGKEPAEIAWIAASEEDDCVIVADRGCSRVLVVSLDVDDKASAVRARLECFAEGGVGALCFADADARRACAFDGSEHGCAVIDVRAAAIAARMDTPLRLATPVYLPAADVIAAVGRNERAVHVVSATSEGSVRVSSVALPGPANCLAPVERSECIRVVVAGRDLEQAPILWLVDTVELKLEHSWPALGGVLALATELDL